MHDKIEREPHMFRIGTIHAQYNMQADAVFIGDHLSIFYRNRCPVLVVKTQNLEYVEREGTLIMGALPEVKPKPRKRAAKPKRTKKK